MNINETRSRGKIIESWKNYPPTHTHTWEGGGGLIRLNPQDCVYNHLPLYCFFCGSFVLVMYCVSHAFVSVYCCLVVTCWERADLLALVCDVWLCFCPFPMWYPRSVVVLIPDLCHLSYFYLAPKKKYSWMQNCSVGPLNVKEILVRW